MRLSLSRKHYNAKALSNSPRIVFKLNETQVRPSTSNFTSRLVRSQSDEENELELLSVGGSPSLLKMMWNALLLGGVARLCIHSSVGRLVRPQLAQLRTECAS